MTDTAADPVEADIWTRSTAPQSPFSLRQVVIGFLVLVVGAFLAFGLPLLLS